VLAAVSILAIGLHNLTDPIQAAQLGSFGWLWDILHQQGIFKVGPVSVLVAYPLIPWFAVMAAGYCFGPIMLLSPEQRQRRMIELGIGLTTAFIVIRGVNVYGDPSRWTTEFPGMAWLSFLRTTKYPPSLDFLLMTLGPAFLVWAWLDKLPLGRTNPLVVFGRVPLFYFIVHFYLIHLLRLPEASGFGLGIVYAVWFFVVVAMYPVCLWFSRVKERNRSWWLSYL
jgi:uncharacterized membrane protein